LAQQKKKRRLPVQQLLLFWHPRLL